MKNIFVPLFLLIGIISEAQTPPAGFVPVRQKTAYLNLSAYNTFAPPQDTFSIPAALKTLRWFSCKGDSIYSWSVIQQKWILAGGAGPFGSTAYNGLSNGVSGIDSIQLGGSLTANTTLYTQGFIQHFDGATVYDFPYYFKQRQSFQIGTGIVSFQGNQALYSTYTDYLNRVKLGINYTGAKYDSATNVPGYMNDKIGYWIATNAVGHGSLGVYTDDTTSKISGIFFHTKDTTYKDAITFFGKHPITVNFSGGGTPTSPVRIDAGNKGLEPFRIATFKDDRSVQWFGYDSTRSDGTITRFIGVDSKGNMLVGTGGAGGGGSSTFAGLTDVNVSSPANLQIAQYQTSDNKWHNHSLVLSDLSGVISYIRNANLASAAKIGKVVSGTADTMIMRNFKDSSQIKFIQGDTSIAAYIYNPLVQQNTSPLTLSSSGAYIFNNSGGGTFTLPDLATNQGKKYFIKNVSGTNAGALTIALTGSDGIAHEGWGETGSVVKLQNGESMTVIAGSSEWYAFGESDIKTMTIAVSDETTALTTGTGKVTFRAPYDMYVQNVRASLNTVSSSGNPTCDINENGTSILGANKLSIDVSEKTSVTAAVATSIADQLIADDSEITIDIDTAGTGAKGLKVIIYYFKRF